MIVSLAGVPSVVLVTFLSPSLLLSLRQNHKIVNVTVMKVDVSLAKLHRPTWDFVLHPWIGGFMETQ
jgi:hypothetical protein